jgi:2-keto-4-pentenoate hydratase
VAVLPEAIRPPDLAAAYAVQDEVHALLAPTRYRARIGWKIGCTTAVMQDYLGVRSPCSAGLFAGTRHANGVSVRAGDYRRIGIECEIGIRLGRDVDAAGGVLDRGGIAAAVDGVMAAIEIVDDRYADWRRTDTPTLVADDFFAAGCVLGRVIPLDEAGDLAATLGTTEINGSEVGRGRGADVLGHPLDALLWLAANMAERGTMLHAGEIVLTGSLVETRWLSAGDRAAIEISGLGRVEMTVLP